MASESQWWQRFGNWAQIGSAVVAMIGFGAIVLQFQEVRHNNRASGARQVYLAYTDLNFRNPQYVKELRHIIDFDEEMETFLVFALTAKYEDMKTIYEQFSLVPIDSFIFTNLDETTSYGAMFNLMMEYNVGAAYFTNGQNVPDDISEASPEQLINMLFGVEGR